MITIKNFIAGLICKKKMRLSKAGCLENNGEIKWLMTMGEHFLPQWFKDAAAGNNEWENNMTETVSKMDKEWFSGDAEFEAAKAKYTAQFGRMVRYFAGSGLVPENWRQSFQLNVGKITVTDHVDFSALDKEGKRHIIRFNLFNKPELSVRARIDKNKPQYCLELVIPACALGNNAIYELWYLKGKNDSGTTYPAFEEKAGVNIASFDYSGFDMRNVFKQAVSINTALCTPADCENCRVRGVCQGYNETPIGDIEIDEKPLTECMLTPEQEKVADWVDGSLSAIAVPGAGKTHVLIERMIRLINRGINPSNILFLSHTRKAVEEISTRVADALELTRDDPNMPTIMTLNGFGYSILRDNEKLLGRTLKLASDGEAKELLERVLNDSSVGKIAGVNYAVMKGQWGLLEKAYSWVKAFKENGEEAFAVRFPNVDVKGVAFVSAALDRLFDEYGYIRFDEQILMVSELFKAHPELAKNLSKVYRYVMVDEYQDINDAQQEMIERLCVHGNLVCVGDDDQSIYEFRGGTVKHMMDFTAKNENVIMDTNFRTNDKIANLSNIIISWNRNRIEKVIKAGRTAENKPVLLQNPENKQIATYIGKLAKRYKPGGVAVIARDNKTLKKMEVLLDEYGIPRSASKDFLTETKVFNVIRDVLRIHAEGPAAASESFSRLYLSMNEFPEDEAGFDECFHDMLLRTGKILDCSDTVANAKTWKLSKLPTAAFGQKLMGSYYIINYTEGVPDMIQDLFDLWFDGTPNELSVLRAILDLFEEGLVGTSERALKLMDTLVKYGDKTRIDFDYGINFCRLLTAHDAKGKEFDSVVVLNADEFIRDGAEEDVRVLYVAVTRAKHTLVLTTSGGEREASFISQIAPAVNQR